MDIKGLAIDLAKEDEAAKLTDLSKLKCKWCDGWLVTNYPSSLWACKECGKTDWE